MTNDRVHPEMKLEQRNAGSRWTPGLNLALVLEQGLPARTAQDGPARVQRVAGIPAGLREGPAFDIYRLGGYRPGPGPCRGGVSGHRLAGFMLGRPGVLGKGKG